MRKKGIIEQPDKVNGSDFDIMRALSRVMEEDLQRKNSEIGRLHVMVKLLERKIALLENNILWRLI